MPQTQDIVAQLPDPIVQLQRLGGTKNVDFFVEKGFIAKIPKDEGYFVHARAMLPLNDLKDGVGFGLWVQVSKDDFDLYLRSIENEELSDRFSCVGTLANTWPGFPETFGDHVKLKIVQGELYITEYLSEPKDIQMRRSLLAQPDDQETKEFVRNLAMSYLVDLQNFAEIPYHQEINKMFDE